MNESVAAGATLHWHGIDVPNAADGVAGITQDAVPVGGRHVYRFEATDAGTYWYHSHQVSHEQVVRGLLGAIVIEPAEPPCHPGRRGRHGAAARLRRPAHPERTRRGRARGRRARLRSCASASSTPTRAPPPSGRMRPTACSPIDGHDVNGPERRRGPPTPHPGRRASGCRGAGAAPRSRAPARGRRPQHPRRRPRGIRPGRTTAVGDARPARLRRPRSARTRPDVARPHVRLRDRPPLRPHRRPPRQLLDHQRAALPRRPDVPRERGRRRRDAHRQRLGRGAPDAPARAPRGRAAHATASRHPEARGGSTRSTCIPARRTRSPSSPTTPASGATTATRSPTRSTGSSRTSCTTASRRPFTINGDAGNRPE